MTQKGQNCFKGVKKADTCTQPKCPPQPESAKDLCRQIYNLQIFLEVLLKLAGKFIRISEDGLALAFFSHTTRGMGSSATADFLLTSSIAYMKEILKNHQKTCVHTYGANC